MGRGVYARARYYDPDVGRFTQPDPIGLAGGLALYAYAGNNPINFVDPLGTTQLNIGFLQNAIDQASSYFTPENIGTTLRTAADVAVDFSGVGGAVKGAITVATGQNPITGEPFTGGFLEAALEVLPAAKRVKQAINAVSNAGQAAANAAKRTKKTTESGIGVTEHSVQQKINREVRSADELDAIKNPLDVGPVKTDRLGRPSQRSVGRNAEVARNPKTGDIVSVNPTSTKKAERLLRRNQNQ